MIQCPCCGQDTDQPSLEALKWVRLSPSERVIVNALAEAYPARMSGEQLAIRLYSGVRNGGPLYARRVIDVHMHSIRKKIAAVGWTAGCGPRGSAGIGLEVMQ